ncbi:MAG TPA: hypothetical protein VFQ41_22910 [Candidatus Angelobacter sp.]|nr:hypothetical protein [Candidatus Angelobacter sp.]
MPRKTLLTAALLVSTAVLGQGQSTNQSTSPAPVNGPFGGPILVTPSASFPSAAPAAGISDAGRAGISIETNSTAPVEAVAGTSGTTSVTTAAGSESNSALNTLSTAPVSDLMPSSSASSVSGTGAGNTVSLAEISGRYKAQKGARNARVLGNDDVEKMLANKSGVTMAKNMPPLGPGSLEQGGQPQTAGAQTAATPTSTTAGSSKSASASQQGQNGATSQTGTPPPASNPGQNASPDTSAENSTMPQVNRNQQSNDARGSRRLPATGGFLPLLGLLGLASGGIGFWFRKFGRRSSRKR